MKDNYLTHEVGCRILSAHRSPFNSDVFSNEGKKPPLRINDCPSVAVAFENAGKKQDHGNKVTSPERRVDQSLGAEMLMGWEGPERFRQARFCDGEAPPGGAVIRTHRSCRIPRSLNAPSDAAFQAFDQTGQVNPGVTIIESAGNRLR